MAAPLVMLLTILVVGEDLRGPSHKYSFNDAKEMFGIIGMFLVLGAASVKEAEGFLFRVTYVSGPT